mgnify:FL=1|tara:strand:+ start:497 stop:844 length:348 start_codon:yes stop_codon:yes gene_type:complete
MKGKYLFREPLALDDLGLYITAAQMQFYLNTKEGRKHFRKGDANFFSYFDNCRVYNLVYDMMETNHDCAKMYWDEKSESVALTFPASGKVAQALASVGSSLGDDFDSGDSFESFM